MINKKIMYIKSPNFLHVMSLASVLTSITAIPNTTIKSSLMRKDALAQEEKAVR